MATGHGADRRLARRVALGQDRPIEIEFVLGDEYVRGRVLDLSEHGLRATYPASAPSLRAGQWLGNVALLFPEGGARHLRLVRVEACETTDDGERALRLSTADDQARAGLWLVLDRLTSGQLGPAEDRSNGPVRVRPIPQRGIYTEQARKARLGYVRKKTGLPLASLEQTTLRAEGLTGNVENLIGSVELPVGLAGPLLFKGEAARGLLFAPMATTEGALVASTTRGAIAVTRGGGVTTRVVKSQMMRVPLFVFSDMRGAYRFCTWVRDHFDAIREQAGRVSRHATLLKVDPELRGNMVTVTFLYETGDAAGQNMTTSCTWHACQWLMAQMRYLDEIRLEDFFIESGVSGDKKVSFQGFISGRGTRVSAECLLPAAVVEEVLKVTPEELVRAYSRAAAFGIQSGTVGWNINVANLLAALFTATGQDIACVHESSVGLLYIQQAAEGVYASMVLPSLVIGTVGGGTHLPRQTELLQLMDCAGPGKVARLAEIIAGFCLALDLSTLSAIAGGQFAAAHERLGRSHPVRWFTRGDLVPSFFEDGVRRALDDPSAVVERVEVRDSFEMANSIITELTARKIEKLIGLVPARLHLAAGEGSGARVLDLVVKVKPLDEEVILMTHRLAAMCGPRIAASAARFRRRMGFAGCHLREQALYEQEDRRFRRHVPVVYATFRDDAREAYVIAMEKLEGLELMDAADDVSGWTDEHRDAAIRAIAGIHAIWYRREDELRARPWLGWAPNAHDMADMRELWEDLAVHAAREFPEWFLESDLDMRRRLIRSLPEWWSRIESMPRTLVHNDFNPRNLAFRREEAGLRPVIWDWELATLHLPQRDLAELLCYTLSPETPGEVVQRWVERHRETLAAETGLVIPADEWREGFRLALFDLALNRVALTLAAHTFRQYGFMRRVVGTLRRLIELDPP